MTLYIGKWYLTLPTADTLSGKNARAWVSMVSYLKKNENENVKTKKKSKQATI